MDLGSAGYVKAKQTSLFTVYALDMSNITGSGYSNNAFTCTDRSFLFIRPPYMAMSRGFINIVYYSSEDHLG